MTKPVHVTFSAGDTGQWRIHTLEAIVGEGLALADRLAVRQDDRLNTTPSTWTLNGITSNTRYATRAEVQMLRDNQEDLGRDRAVCAALIPIRKTAAWWALAQDERREIVEERSRHFTIGMDYLPAIARRLHHSRELGEPFDFLTWFEFAPEHEAAFDEMLRRLRATEEWRYVDREVDIRLRRL